MVNCYSVVVTYIWSDGRSYQCQYYSGVELVLQTVIHAENTKQAHLIALTNLKDLVR